MKVAGRGETARVFSPEGHMKTSTMGGTRGGPRGGGFLGAKMGAMGVTPGSGAAADKAQANWNNNLGNQVGQFQQWAREGVQGYGATVGRQLQREIGNFLGSLNGIGALRSGGVKAGMRDIMSGYGESVGNFAQQATLGALGMAQEEKDRESERRFRTRQYQDARRSGRQQMIGQMLGAGASLIPGVGSLFSGAGAVPTAPVASPSIIPIRGNIPLR